MNQEINPIIALLILIIFASLLGGKFWAHGESISERGYSYMHVHPDGSVYIQLHNQLFAFTEQGELNKQIDLEFFGVNPNMPSDFAFFSNGDLLLRKAVSPGNFLHNLQRFLRLTNTSSEYSTDDQKGLFRCRVETEQCRPFSEQALNLEDAFALAIDRQTDRVFISDASRHHVYLFSEEGEELDRIDKNLKFPNQVSYNKGELFIANTNHHALTSVIVNDLGFTESFQTMSILVNEIDQHDETWPASFLLTDDLTWVINSKTTMSHGGIYLYDKQGDFVKKLVLPKNADPLAIIQMGDQVLVTDYSQELIYRYDLEGGQLENFIAPFEMRSVVQEITEKREYYQIVEQVFMALFKALVSLGFSVALYQFYNDKTMAGFSESIAFQKAALKNPDIHWIKADRKYQRTVRLMVFTLLPLFLMLIIFLIIDTDNESDLDWFRAKLGLMAIFGILLSYWLINSLKLKIGILDNIMILVNAKGKHVAGIDKQICYSDSMLNIGDIGFNISRQQKLFSTYEMVEHVYPLLKSARYLTNSQMQMLLFKSNKLISTVTILLVLSLFYYLFFVLL